MQVEREYKQPSSIYYVTLVTWCYTIVLLYLLYAGKLIEGFGGDRDPHNLIFVQHGDTKLCTKWQSDSEA